jgi:hypothetical protein
MSNAKNHIFVSSLSYISHLANGAVSISTCNGVIDSKVKYNPQNNFIYGHQHCGKSSNSRGIITTGHKSGRHKHLYRKIFDGLKRHIW